MATVVTERSKPEERALGLVAAADMLGVSASALYHLVWRRQVPHRRAGRRIVFLESELKAYLHGLPGLKPDQIDTQDNGEPER
jgi:predicted DNA-binding transcriptional regulator AlpA